MTPLSEMLLWAAEHLPVWRDTAVVLLALVVLGCLWFVAEAGA